MTRPRAGAVLPRPRLFRLLDKARDFPLTWITGSPGSGKTTLVSHYLEKGRHRHLWYRVDTGDRELTALFRDLSVTLNPGLHGERPHEPHTDEQVRTFFRRAFARLRIPTTLVFDDYQEVGEDAELHRVLCMAVDEMAPGHRIFVLSRKAPPAPFSGLRARGQLHTFDARSLDLSPEEARQLVRRRRARARAIANTDQAHGLCAGWMAGFLLSMQRAAEKDVASDDLPIEIAEYFEHQVFARAPTHLQQMWLMTAWMPRFTARMAAKVSGLADAEESIESLVRARTFIEPDGDEGSFRYHPLWMKFLRVKTARVLESADLQRLKHRSAVALGAAGNHEAAVELALAVGDWDFAAQLVNQAAPGLLSEGRVSLLRRWISRLPRSVVTGDPWLLYRDAEIQTLLDPLQAMESIDKCFESFAQQDDVAGQALCASLVVNAHAAEWGNFSGRSRWFGILSGLLASDPRFPDPVSELRSWSALLFICTMEIGDFPFAADCAARVHKLCRGPLTAAERLSAATNLLSYWCQVGTAEQAREVEQEFAVLSESPDVPTIQRVLWELYRGTRAFHAGDIQASLRHKEVMLGLLGKEGPPPLLMMTEMLRVWLFLAQSRYREARARLESQAPRLNHARLNEIALYHHLTAWLELVESNSNLAVEHARRAVEVLGEAGSRSSIVCSHCVLALALADSGRTDEALRAIDVAERGAAGAHGIIPFTIKIVRADVLRRIPRRHAEFQVELATAFATGRLAGFVNVLIWIPRMMSRLCAAALEAGIEADHVEKLVRARDLPPPDLDTDTWPWRVRIFTLGRFDVLVDGRRLTSSGKARRRPIDLLKLLLALGGRKVSVERLTAELWPHSEGDAAYRAFKISLHRLRRLLGSDEAIRVESGEITLDAARVSVDIWTFERWFGQAQAHPEASESLSAAERSLALYHGEFLGGVDQPWVQNARERLRSKYVRGVILCGERLASRENWSAVIALYERGIDVEPLAEEMYVRLIRCYQQQGRDAEAMAVYRRCETMLFSLLKQKPGRVLRSLYEQLRQSV